MTPHTGLLIKTREGYMETNILAEEQLQEIIPEVEKATLLNPDKTEDDDSEML